MFPVPSWPGESRGKSLRELESRSVKTQDAVNTALVTWLLVSVAPYENKAICASQPVLDTEMKWLIAVVQYILVQIDINFMLSPSNAIKLLQFVRCDELVFEVIYQTQETVFHHISKHGEESWKYNAQQSIFDKVWGVWKCDETLSWVFDISSQSKLKLRSKRN